MSKGTAIDAAAIDLIADTNGVDLAVSYRDHAGVLYRDRLLGKYEAVPLDTLPAGAKGLTAFDVNSDSWTDLAADGLLLLNHQGKLEPLAGLEAKGPPTFVDLANRGIADVLAANGVFRNLGARTIREDPAKIPAAVAAVESDFDGDGRVGCGADRGRWPPAPAAQRHRDEEQLAAWRGSTASRI